MRMTFPAHASNEQWVPFGTEMYDAEYLNSIPSISTYNGGGAFLDGNTVWELCAKD